jgi:hypothetical protein
MKPLAIMLLCSVACCPRAADPGTLKLTQIVPLPGVKGRFDHFAIGANGHRLFVAALGNNTLEVTDITAGKRVQRITGLRKPTGIVYLTSFFSAERDEFYLAVPLRDGQNAEIRIYKPADGA